MTTPALTPEMFVALFVLSAVFYEVVKLMVGHLFGRFISPGFVKTKECEQCSAKNSTSDAEMKRDIKAIKKALISMATKGAMTEDDIQGLVS